MSAAITLSPERQQHAARVLSFVDSQRRADAAHEKLVDQAQAEVDRAKDKLARVVAKHGVGRPRENLHAIRVAQDETIKAQEALLRLYR